MFRKKSELPTIASEKAKTSEQSKTTEVAFELSDEELEDIAGGGCDCSSAWCVAAPRLRSR